MRFIKKSKGEPRSNTRMTELNELRAGEEIITCSHFPTKWKYGQCSVRTYSSVRLETGKHVRCCGKAHTRPCPRKERNTTSTRQCQGAGSAHSEISVRSEGLVSSLNFQHFWKEPEFTALTYKHTEARLAQCSREKLQRHSSESEWVMHFWRNGLNCSLRTTYKPTPTPIGGEDQWRGVTSTGGGGEARAGESQESQVCGPAAVGAWRRGSECH